jgi:hypothetical protein
MKPTIQSCKDEILAKAKHPVSTNIVDISKHKYYARAIKQLEADGIIKDVVILPNSPYAFLTLA